MNPCCTSLKSSVVAFPQQTGWVSTRFPSHPTHSQTFSCGFISKVGIAANPHTFNHSFSLVPICSPCAQSGERGQTRAALTLPINQSHLAARRFSFPPVNSTTGCLQVSVFSTRKASSHVGHWLECSEWVTEWPRCSLFSFVLITFKVSSMTFVPTFASELNALSHFAQPFPHGVEWFPDVLQLVLCNISDFLWWHFRWKRTMTCHYDKDNSHRISKSRQNKRTNEYDERLFTLTMQHFPNEDFMWEEGNHSKWHWWWLELECKIS